MQRLVGEATRRAEADDPPLGAPAHGAGDVQRRRDRAAAGRRSCGLGQRVVQLVDLVLEGLDVARGQAGLPLRRSASGWRARRRG